MPISSSIRSQAQPDHWQERHDSRSGDRSRQSGRQRTVAADAGAPCSLLWPGAAAGGRRWRLRHARQSSHSEDMGRLRHGLPQESRPQDRGHGQKQLGYRKLRNFRAGIEAGISCLKRAYGLARCTWRGLDHFKGYVRSSVVAYNLVLFTRLKPS
ncbi:transposase [Allomesorhizobium camelthorni]|uniref:transposase n=1 Tax=Allomesorhizobium camelthorni TaxID=475069 RepID=UPI003CCD6505